MISSPDLVYRVAVARSRAEAPQNVIAGFAAGQAYASAEFALRTVQRLQRQSENDLHVWRWDACRWRRFDGQDADDQTTNENEPHPLATSEARQG